MSDDSDRVESTGTTNPGDAPAASKTAGATPDSASGRLDPGKPPAETTEFGQIAAFVRKLGAIGPLAIIAATAPALGGFLLLYYMQTVAEWLRSHETTGPLLFIVCFTVLAGLALLPTYAQALAGGFAFGTVLGSGAALSGFLGAALLGYAIARYFSGDRADEVIAEHPKWQAVYDGLLHSGFFKTLGIVMLVRVPPNSPFAITNLVLAATKVPVVIYAVGTLVGMAPRTIAAVYIGAQISDFAEAQKPWWLFVGGIVAAVIVIAIIGLIANRAITRMTQAGGARDDPPAAR